MSYFNPEFQRNLWHELSLHKLIATPFILTTVLYLGYLIGNEWVSVVAWSVWLFMLLTVVYGAYLAGDTIADEVQEHTWPVQRLTSLSPWTMTWGKVFGGTIFAWYIGLCCLLVISFVHAAGYDVDSELVIHAHPFQSMLYLTGLAVLFHALAILFSLLHLQKTHTMIKRTIFVPILALILGIYYIPYLLQKVPSEAINVVWYHMNFPELQFSIMSIVMNMGWVLVGAYMYMRHELQFVNTIWVWLAFLVYQCGYFIGFTFAPDFENLSNINVFDRTVDLPVFSVRVGIAFLICYLFTYVMAAVEKIEVIEIRNALRCKVTGKLKLVFDVLPRWVPTMAITAILGIALLGYISMEGYFQLEMATLIFALLAFMLRDIGLFIIFDITGKKRHVTTAMVYLVLLYIVIPAIVNLLHLSFLLPWFYPRPDYAMFYAIGAPILQAVVVWVIAKQKFQVAVD